MDQMVYHWKTNRSLLISFHVFSEYKITLRRVKRTKAMLEISCPKCCALRMILVKQFLIHSLPTYSFEIMNLQNYKTFSNFQAVVVAWVPNQPCSSKAIYNTHPKVLFHHFPVISKPALCNTFFKDAVECYFSRSTYHIKASSRVSACVILLVGMYHNLGGNPQADWHWYKDSVSNVDKFIYTVTTTN